MKELQKRNLTTVTSHHLFLPRKIFMGQILHFKIDF